MYDLQSNDSPCPLLRRCDSRRRERSVAKRILKLDRASVECSGEVVIEVALPSAVPHQEQVIPWPQDPSEPTLKTQNPGFIIVLNQIGPGNIGREAVVRLNREQLGEEIPLFELDAVPRCPHSKQQMVIEFES